MGNAVADTPRGGSAVPTEFTKTAGAFALAASGLWLASLAIIWLGKVADDFDTWIYLVWSASILVAGAFTFVATLGLRQRHETFRRSGTVGLVILGVGVVLSIISWALPLWMTVQGVGMLLVVLAILPKRVAPRAASVAYGSGMLIGGVLFGVLTAMKVGTRINSATIPWRGISESPLASASSPPDYSASGLGSVASNPPVSNARIRPSSPSQRRQIAAFTGRFRLSGSS